MPSPYTWDVARPAGSEAINIGDNLIRDDKTTLRNVLRTLVPFGTATTGWRQVQIDNDQYLAQNASYDGAAWNRDDVALTAAYIKFLSTGGFEIAHTAAAANPITWTKTYTLRSGLGGAGAQTPLAEWHVRTTGTGFPRGIVSEQFTDDDRGAQFFGRKSRVTAGVAAAVLSGDRLFDTGGDGYDGASYFSGAYIRFITVENYSAAAGGTEIRFITTPRGTVVSNNFMILGDRGNLDLGVTATPTYTADVKHLDIKATWNAGGVTFTFLRVQLTDSASAAASRLVDMLVGGTTKFALEKDGRPVYTSRSVRVTKSGNQVDALGTVAVTWDTETWDTDTLHDTGANTHRLTASIAGKWRIMVQFNGVVDGSGTTGYLLIRKNGTTEYAREKISISGIPGDDPEHANAIVDLAAGEWVDIAFSCAAGTSTQQTVIAATTWASMHYIGA